MAITFNPAEVTLMGARLGQVPQEVSDQILTGVKSGSAFMRLAKAIDIHKPETRFTHMSGVGAYWVDEARRIQADKPSWLNLTMRTKKLAVIIPVSKEMLSYSLPNFFELLQDEIAEEFAKKFDAAAFAGIDSPYAWSVLGAATACGNVAAETQDKHKDISAAMGKIEAKDFDPNGVAALKRQLAKYRESLDGAGQPIFSGAGGQNSLLCLPVAFLSNQALAGAKIGECVGDWNHAYYGILKGIEYEVLTEATLTTIEADDAPGAPLSLPERDLVALKATLEVGMMIARDDAFAVITTA